MAIDGAVAAELKENGAWVPLTLAESVSARCGSNTTCKDSNSARNPQFSEIIGKLGHGEKESVNCGGSTKSTEGCRKVEFMIPGNSDFGQHQTAVEAPFETKMGTQLHNHNFRFEFGLDSTKASTISKNKTPKKSRLGLNKKSQKRLKMKRHRPKVFDETKPLKPSTPKLRTPKRGKYVKRDSPNTVVDPLKDVDREAVGDYEKESCRKKLDFDIENCIVNQNPKVCNGIGSETEVQHKQQSNSRFSSLIVYRRVFRCLKSSRKLGPNCPKMFKKARMRRQRATVFYKHISLVPFPRNQRTTMKELMNFTPMVKDRKRESRSLNRSQKSSNACVTIDRISKEAVKLQESEMSTLNLAWKVNSKRKRSNSFTPRQDLSSFIIDLSKLQLSEAFLLKAACIRTRDRDKLSAGVEVQDDLVQNLVTKELTEQEELPRDDVFSCNENIQKCPTEYEDVILEVDMDLPVQNGEGSVVSSTKEMGSFSDNATSYLVGPHDVENNVLESQDYDALTEALVDFAVQRMEGLNIDDGFNQLVVRDQNAHGALVPSNGKFDPFKKRKEWPKVDLDVETKRVWNVLMEKGEDTEKEDDEKTKYWKEQRELYRGRVDSFIARMQLIQGDRRFSPWKGSVVDSVVGVFLTQNVSDHLSSSTFMSLTARFPPPSVSEDIVCDGRSCCAHDIHQVKTAEPTSDKCEELSTMEKDPSSCFSNQVGVDSENGRSCCVNDIQQVKTAEPPSDKCEESSPMEKDPSFCPSNPVGVDSEDGNKTTTQSVPTPRRKKGKTKDKQENTINWDDLRKQYSNGIPRNRTQDNMDSVDWEAVRRAPVGELAKVILERGMNNILAVRIKDFLDRIVRDHGSIDLEWLRDVPPDKAKEYLLSIPGLGLKSVECVRLLTLHHHAFPVDTNISRILVRLGWVPLQPLPEDVQIHLLEQYPLLDSIQKYIWPRLCDIEQPTMYECHCQLIACGKAICTKKQPNCNACPMRGECRHYASAFASAKSRLKGPGEENTPTQSSVAPSQGSNTNSSPPMLSYSGDDSSQGIHNSRNCEPIIEYPPSPEPEVLCTEIQESDIEDFGYESEIPTLDITSKEFIKDLLSSMDGEDDMSKALVALRPEVAAIPMPKLKDVKRLRTVHHVYELPDSHSLLSGFRKREPDDPCPYLLAIWTADDTSNAAQESRKPCNCDQSRTCASCSRETVHQHQNDQTVQGTILIPCRTANKGSFPLNGTYFQVNEVFADHKSSRHPIAVPREWIWNLRRRPLFCGTSLTAICRGMSLLEIAYFFCHGFICIRGVDGKTGSATPLARRFHVCKTRQIGDDE